jgi:hypothetical protein
MIGRDDDELLGRPCGAMLDMFLFFGVMMMESWNHGGYGGRGHFRRQVDSVQGVSSSPIFQTKNA